MVNKQGEFMKELTIPVILTEQELMDVQSALAFFEDEYSELSDDTAPQTLRAVRKLSKKLWTVLKKARIYPSNGSGIGEMSNDRAAERR